MLGQTLLNVVVATLLAIQVPVVSAGKKVNLPSGSKGAVTVIPNRYIVQFDSAASLQSSPLKPSIHEEIYSEFAARGLDITIKQEYTSDLFSGASIAVNSDADLLSLVNMTGIVSITPVHQLTRQNSDRASQWAAGVKALNIPVQAASQASTNNVATSTVTSCTTQKKKVSCKTSTVVTTATATPSSRTGFSTHSQIGVDKVQASGNTGKGIKVAVIDSGVDYNRAPLGGCFGTNCKVAGGFNYVENNGDPIDTCDFHGTFVAGIIAANDNEYNVPGVAPGALIYSYRVFDCDSNTSDDIIIAAMLKAKDDGVNIINLSLGESSGWTSNILSVVASRLVAQGVFVAVSAGNEGESGAFLSYGPASGLGVAGVGSVNNTVLVAHNATVSGGASHGPITYYSGKTFPAGDLPVYTYPDGSNGCNNQPIYGDLSGYLVVVKETGDPSCTTSTQAQTAYNNGNRAIIVAQNQDHEPIYQNYFLTNYATISQADGDFLLSQIPAGQSNSGNFKVSFSFKPAPRYNSYSGGAVSYFSEIGPTFDMYLSTQITAPGSKIFGVSPSDLGSWSVRDGTSFAAPMMAGAAALYLSANPGATPQQVLTAIENSGNPIANAKGSSVFKTAVAQGAGIFNASVALNPGVAANPPELYLNDTANFNGAQWITITNTGSTFKTFKLSHVPAGTINTFVPPINQSVTNSYDNEIPATSNSANVKILLTTVPLLPGASLKIPIYFTAPSGLDPSTFPVYSGWIKVTGGNSPISIPYAGVVGKLYDHPVWDGTDVFLGLQLPTTLDANYYTVDQSTPAFDYTCNADGSRNAPIALWRAAGGSRFVTLDLVDANANLGFAPNYNSRRDLTEAAGSSAEERDFVPIPVARAMEARKPNAAYGGLLNLWCTLTKNKSSLCAQDNSGNQQNTYAQVPIIGNVYQQDYAPRSSANSEGDGKPYVLRPLDPPYFSNGTQIPNGTYRYLLRGLRINGDITQESNYDTWLGQPFTIAYADGQPGPISFACPQPASDE